MRAKGLLDELARRFVQAAVTRVLKEQALAESPQMTETIWVILAEKTGGIA